MNAPLLDNAELIACVRAMAHALDRGDEAALGAAVAGFERSRCSNVTARVRRVANDLQFALEHFHANARLVDMAQRQVPDAKIRLAHVLKMTDEAAHRTMDLVERSAPLADQATREAERLIGMYRDLATPAALAPQLRDFLMLIAGTIGEVRSNLAEVLITQGYQDLSGQIIRGVMTLIQELEVALAELFQIAGSEQHLMAGEGDDCRRPRLNGPAVPGLDSAIGGQHDVDALLSELGV
jgi:chemotaxis protein CheZ